MGQRGDRAASAFLLVSLWVSATLIVGVVAWTAVARLGREGDSSTQSSLSQAEVRRLLDRQPLATSSGPTSPTPPTTSSPSTSAPPSGTPGSPPSQGTRRSASWTVNGGRVSASCQGSAIRLSPSFPADGWTMEIKDTGPDVARVEFSRGDADSKVEAVCSKGIPTLKSDDGDS